MLDKPKGHVRLTPVTKIFRFTDAGSPPKAKKYGAFGFVIDQTENKDFDRDPVGAMSPSKYGPSSPRVSGVNGSTSAASSRRPSGAGGVDRDRRKRKSDRRVEDGIDSILEQVRSPDAMSPVERREIRGPEGKRDSDNFDNRNQYFQDLVAQTSKNAKKAGKKMKKGFFKTFS